MGPEGMEPETLRLVSLVSRQPTAPRLSSVVYCALTHFSLVGTAKNISGKHQASNEALSARGAFLRAKAAGK
jgi:hypothetical protein